MRPHYLWYRHCAALADVLQRVADGELTRVMVFLPPRHSKSETVSRLLSAYYLHRHPDRWVGLNSYAAELAFTLSRNARENYLLGGGELKGDARAVKHWETAHGGGLWAAGVGGPITGKGFHLGIIDDPLKNAEEAASEVIRAKQKDWYASTFYTRAEPHAAVIIVQTRWHEADLCGGLIDQEDEEQPEGWHIVNLPAIAEPPPTFPTSCTVEADWREAGEALCPERYPVERLKRIEKRVGGYYWSALFQQRPTAKEGSFFKVGRLEIAEVAPAGLRRCRAWDLAATPGAGDFTAGILMGADAQGGFWVLDVRRDQWATDDRNREMLQAAALDGVHVPQRLPQDPGQAGVDQAKAMVRMLAGYPVRVARISGSKEVRADPFSAQVNAGNVKLLKAPWNRDFIEELRQFPLAKDDDQVDAAADAFNELALPGEVVTDPRAHTDFWTRSREPSDPLADYLSG